MNSRMFQNTSDNKKTCITHQKIYRLNANKELIEYIYERPKTYTTKTVRTKPLISSYFTHSEEEEKLFSLYKDKIVLASQLTPLLNKNNPDKPQLTEKQVKDYLYRNKSLTL